MLIAIACPARAIDNTPETTNSTKLVSLAFDFHNKFNDLDTTDNYAQNLSPSQVLESMLDLDSNLSHTNDLAEHLGNNGHSPEKAPTFEFTINPNFSLPPHERLAASTFGASVQIEALFLLVFEFHPEILGIKHFLAPLNTISAVPWFLRPSATNRQGRTAGWKESNTLYTGIITYLS
ncbi:MAG: hypothetical protein ABJK37_10400 [Paraglaciecola sp.]|uniref:hypothetical protein n=1 Tax=Paraglaciecola sp. TaxID=1920173 RepID=UPI0032973CE2